MAKSRIRIVLEEGGLVARISVIPGDALQKGDVAAALGAAGIVQGLDAAAVAKLESRVSDKSFSVDGQVIARGTPATPGRDGGLDVEFSIGPRAGMSRADGSLDLLDRGLITRVKAGETIGREQEPDEGKPGEQVTGEEIAATPGKESKTQLGDGVEKQDNGLIRAVRGGAIHYRPDSLLDVNALYEHPGNVDTRSGHLRTEGSILIKGSVNTNFEVKAGADVEIKGGVLGGQVEAGGSVQIAGAIMGGNDGYVRAGGDLRARHAQLARLYSEGTISLATECTSTSVHARKLEVGRRLLGGDSTVETSIVVEEAGAPSGAGTHLRVGEPLEPLRDAARSDSAADKARRALSRRRATGRRGKSSRAKGGKKSREALALEREQTKRKQARCATRAELLKGAHIVVKRRVNAGVLIHFGSRRLHIEDTLGATRFAFDQETQSITSARLET